MASLTTSTTTTGAPINVWDWNGWYGTFLTFLIMLGFAGSLDWDRFKEIFDNKYTFGTVLLALLWQILVMPAIGYALALAFKVDIHILFGIVITMASPADIMCQYYTFIAGADKALSVSITLFTHLLSFGSIPLNIYFYIIMQQNDDRKKQIGLDDINYEWGFLAMQVAVVVIPTIIGLSVASYEDVGSKMCMLAFGLMGALLRYIKMFYDYGYWAQTFGYRTEDLYIPLCLIAIAYVVPTTFIALLQCCCGCESTSDQKKLTKKIKEKRGRAVVTSFGIESSMRNIIIACAIIGVNINNTQLRLEAIRMPIIYTTYAYIINLFIATMLYCCGWSLPEENELYDNYGNPYKDESIGLHDTYKYIETTYTTTKKKNTKKNIENEAKYHRPKPKPKKQKEVIGVQYYVPTPQPQPQVQVVQPQMVYVPQQQTQMVQTQPVNVQQQQPLIMTQPTVIIQ